MIQKSPAGLVALLTTYSYWAVFACIAIESTGIPFPGETMLLVAAIYAGSTHQLAPVLVIAAAESFAILGDNLGFWVGREGDSRLLRRNAHLVRLNERKLKLGLSLPQAWRQSRLLRARRFGAAHVGGEPFGNPSHGVETLPALQCGFRHHLGHVLRPGG